LFSGHIQIVKGLCYMLAQIVGSIMASLLIVSCVNIRSPFVALAASATVFNTEVRPS